MFQYFKGIPKSNDLSRSAHLRIACFLSALHTKTLESLKMLRAEKSLDGKSLLAAWHERLEGRQRNYRKAFFLAVIQMSHKFHDEASLKDKEAREKEAREKRAMKAKKSKETNMQEEASRRSSFSLFRTHVFLAVR